MFGLACDSHLFIVSFGLTPFQCSVWDDIQGSTVQPFFFLVKAYKSCVYAEGIITQFEKVCTSEIKIK